jgi:hypothetical protein
MEKKEYNKKYYQENKANIKKELSKKIHCDVCNKDISIWNLSKHRKTNKHILLKMSTDPDIMLYNMNLFDQIVRILTDNLEKEELDILN